MPKASKKSSYILGLDLATTCGWALIDEASGKAMTGHWLFSSRKRDFCVGARYMRFEKALEEIVAKYKISAIAYEDVMPFAHKNIASVRLYNGWVAVLSIFSEKHKIPLWPVAIKTIKKHAVGHGAASKADMIESARARWPEAEVATDDEADAIFAASAGIEKYGK